MKTRKTVPARLLAATGLSVQRQAILIAGGLAFAGAWLLATPGPAYAQDGLVADRPDFTEATTTVGRGVFQIEFGYTLGRDSQDGTTILTHSFGEPLLRAGVLAEWLELRLGASPVAQRTTAESSRHSEAGLEDLYLGVKLELTRQHGILPATAILPQMTVPTGSGGFSNGRSLPGVNFLYSWDATDEVSLAASTQVNQAVGDSGDGYAEWAQSVSAGLALGARNGLYGEWYAFFRAEPEGTRVEHYVNGGLSWLATDDVQWDIRVGAGLSDLAEDLYVGTGITIRIR